MPQESTPAHRAGRSRPATPRGISPPEAGWRLRLYIVIFEADTRAGRWFDILLLWMILASVTAVMIDSVDSYHNRYGAVLRWLDWTFTGLFTVEYVLRLVCVRHPWRYAFSFFGIIDLLAIAPTYLALLIPELHAFANIRVLRMLRIFRILKLVEYVSEYSALGRALWVSRRKIFVFLSVVFLVLLVMASLMYVVEGPQNGFTSVPVAMYWAITTMTTVGFGDITPHTNLGRIIASLMMLLGWGTLAVPTGIVSAELTAQTMRQTPTTRTCHECLSEGHLPGARFCRDCGAPLPARIAD
ncbi:MAG: ion transporter [Pseudomonadales bacterium]